jgi:hypothetical protein
MTTRDRIRFRPPVVAVSRELAWVLARSFAVSIGQLPRLGGSAAGAACEDGAAGSDAGELDLALAVELAHRLGLAPRLGLRVRNLPELAGGPLATELARASSLAAGSQLRALEATRVVAEVAGAAGIRCCFLKGMALEALGLVATGARPVADVDVLVPEEHAAPLAALLAAVGFAPGGPDYPHQLAPLVHPRLGCVELHRHLPGVRLPGAAGFATFEALAGAGLLRAWPGDEMPVTALLPSPPALLAHLLAHALAQHGFRPAAYPTLRVLGDLIDLGVAGDGGEDLLASALPLVAGSVRLAEAHAAAEACRLLASGRVLELIHRDGDGWRLLRHLLAGALDGGYRQALKLRELRYPLAVAGRPRAWLAALRGALALSRDQVDAIYGQPRRAWGYAARRVVRPFDLAWRAGRSLMSSPARW